MSRTLLLLWTTVVVASLCCGVSGAQSDDEMDMKALVSAMKSLTETVNELSRKNQELEHEVTKLRENNKVSTEFVFPAEESTPLNTSATESAGERKLNVVFLNPSDSSTISLKREGNELNVYVLGEKKATIDSTGLAVNGNLTAEVTAPSCPPGFVNLRGGGICIMKDAKSDAGCYGDECYTAGYRPCNCYELRIGLFYGDINPITETSGPYHETTGLYSGQAGEYCLTGVGHCAGSGTYCNSGSSSHIAKVWPNYDPNNQPATWVHIDTVATNSICDSSLPYPHSGYPYGMYRCCLG